MNFNKSTQRGQGPRELTQIDRASDRNINELLCAGSVNISQPSNFQMHSGNMIPSQRSTATTPRNYQTTFRGAGDRREYQGQRREQQHESRQQRGRGGRPRWRSGTRSLARRQQRRERWLRRLEELEREPNRQPTRFRRHSSSFEDHPGWWFVDYIDQFLEYYEWGKMTDQEYRDQIEVRDYEGFAVLEQVARQQDEREQSQHIKVVQEIDNEKREELKKKEAWEQQQLQDFETIQNPPEKEQLDDFIEQTRQIRILEREDFTRQLELTARQRWDQERLNDFLKTPTPLLYHNTNRHSKN